MFYHMQAIYDRSRPCWHLFLNQVVKLLNEENKQKRAELTPLFSPLYALERFALLPLQAHHHRDLVKHFSHCLQKRASQRERERELRKEGREVPSRVRLREGPIGVRITLGQPTIG